MLFPHLFVSHVNEEVKYVCVNVYALQHSCIIVEDRVMIQIIN